MKISDGKWLVVSGLYQTWINNPLGRLTGEIPFNYQIMTIGEVPPSEKPWFINPGLTLING